MPPAKIQMCPHHGQSVREYAKNQRHSPTAPILTTASVDGQVTGAIPDAERTAHDSTVTRVIIPSIGVDSKAVEVGWEVKEQNGQQVAVWQVAECAVGQHRGSANPGEGENIVLAGHVGGYGKVF